MFGISYQYIPVWWYTSENYESVGMMKFPTEWTNIQKNDPKHQPDSHQLSVNTNRLLGNYRKRGWDVSKK